MADLNQQRSEFDRMTQQMSDVASYGESAPNEHDPFYETTLLNIYSRAFEYIKAKPELVKQFKILGSVAVKASYDESRTVSSLMRLQNYADQGLIDAEILPPVTTKGRTKAIPYSEEDFYAFSSLFNDPLIQEKVETVESDDSNEDDMGSIEDEINTLDILEHLERNDIDKSSLALVANALELRPLNIKQLRDSDWEIMKLSKDELAKFKSAILQLRSRVQDLLSEVGIPTRWVVIGKDDKLAFKLLIGKSAEDIFDPKKGLKNAFGSTFDGHIKDLPDSEIREPKIRPTIRRDGEEPAPASSKVLELHGVRLSDALFIVISAMDTGETRHNMVVRQLADDRGLTRLEARNIIDQLIAQEKVFKNGTDGKDHLLSPHKPAATSKAKTTTSKEKPVRDRSKASLLSEEQSKHVPELFRAIVGARHLEAGLTIAEISHELGIPFTDAKEIVNKLAKQGLLSTVTRHLQRGKARSRRNREGVYALFPDKEAWDTFKDDPTDYLGRVKIAQAENSTV